MFCIATIIKPDGKMYYIKSNSLTLDINEAEHFKRWDLAQDAIFTNKHNETCIAWFVMYCKNSVYKIYDTVTSRNTTIYY